MTIRASTNRWTTALSEPSTWIAPASARISPEATESTEIESTVPRISPESAAATREQGAADQQRLAEADVHAGLIQTQAEARPPLPDYSAR